MDCETIRELVANYQAQELIASMRNRIDRPRHGLSSACSTALRGTTTPS
jgi:hypothetical protein